MPSRPTTCVLFVPGMGTNRYYYGQYQSMDVKNSNKSVVYETFEYKSSRPDSATETGIRTFKDLADFVPDMIRTRVNSKHTHTDRARRLYDFVQKQLDTYDRVHFIAHSHGALLLYLVLRELTVETPISKLSESIVIALGPAKLIPTKYNNVKLRCALNVMNNNDDLNRNIIHRTVKHEFVPNTYGFVGTKTHTTHTENDIVPVLKKALALTKAHPTRIFLWNRADVEECKLMTSTHTMECYPYAQIKYMVDYNEL